MAEPPPSLSDVAGSLHGALIADQLSEERARKASLEERALAVITTSGALATLLIALAAFAKQASTAPLGDVARRLIVVAASGFIAAAVLALVIVAPWKYREADPTKLDDRIMRARWSSRNLVEEARKNAVLSYHTLVHARKLNDCKAKLLFLAVVAEVVAILAAGAAAAVTVLS